MTHPENHDADELFRRLAEAQERALADRAPIDGVRRMLLIRTPPAGPGRRRAIVAGAISAAAALGGFALWAQSRPLQFAVGERKETAGVEGAPLVARADSELPVRFSDGSSITFAAGTVGRVHRLTSNGADVVLDRGQIDAHVVHALQTLWMVRAGPFRIRVTGTRFSATWNPEAQRFAVALHEGGVLVDGAFLGAGVHLQAGQGLQVDLPAGLARTRALAATPSSAPLSSDVATGAPRAAGEPMPTRTVVARPKARGEVMASGGGDGGIGEAPAEWRALAERGAHAAALHAAEVAGFARLCRELDARGLLTLGDVGRYAGAPARAQEAFEALVARFRRDQLAADAMFSLGRLAFEAGEAARAAHWFESYTALWPEAALAEQAAGRLLELRAGGSDTGAARRAASVYLGRHPNGPRASLARRTLAAPAANRR